MSVSDPKSTGCIRLDNPQTAVDQYEQLIKLLTAAECFSPVLLARGHFKQLCRDPGQCYEVKRK
jgi:hypothetical protein